MDILDNMRIKFESPLWAMVPELAVIDAILEMRPDIIDLFADDVQEGMTNNKMGRKDGPTVEQILRAGIYKQLRRLTYRELEFHQHDSAACKEFLHLQKTFSSSVLQEHISKISAKNLKLAMAEIVKMAGEMGYEDFKVVRIDSTPVWANVQRPTNNSLVMDCIKSAARFYEKIKDDYAEKYNEIEAMRFDAKKINYELNNVKGKKNEKITTKQVRALKMKALFSRYLKLLAEIHQEVKNLIKDKMSNFSEYEKENIRKLEKNMSIVYKNAYKFQIEDEKVKNEDKIFSIYEEHTDIIVKGIRDIVFGHKVNLATGKSNLILYCNIEDGNPSDKQLFQEPILTIKKDYNVDKFQSVATDGGYASLVNRDFAKKHFVNVVFTKIVGSLQNITEDEDTEKELKKWRAGIEGNISNLKRGFDLNRVVWKGKKLFDAKVFWSVIGYNIRVLSGHILKTIKQE